jgi:hypothetical protein
VFHRSWSFMSAASALALLPLAMPHGSQSRQLAVSFSATPVQIDVKVRTAIRPLDLAQLSVADFGDADATN